MRRIRQPIALGILVGLAACAQPQVPAPGAASAAVAERVDSGEPPRNQCNAEAAQFLVGQPVRSDTLQRALAAAGADMARRLRPDSIVTKEYEAGRLNVVVDAQGRVLRVHCG